MTGFSCLHDLPTFPASFPYSIPKERKLAGNPPGTKYPASMLHEYIHTKLCGWGGIWICSGSQDLHIEDKGIIRDAEGDAGAGCECEEIVI